MPQRGVPTAAGAAHSGWYSSDTFQPWRSSIGSCAEGDAANTTTLFVALAWLVAFAVIGYQKTNFSCPRCGELFFRAWDDRPWRKTWQSNPFARSCRHCSLPKWSTADGNLLGPSKSGSERSSESTPV
jgi:hypothetical protein